MIMQAYQLALPDGKFEKDYVSFLRKPAEASEESALIKGVMVKKEKAHPNMPDRVCDSPHSRRHPEA